MTFSKFLSPLFFTFSILFFLLFTDAVIPQGRPGMISGTVLDQATQAPVEYANIVLLSAVDTSLITGTISDDAGDFILAPIRNGAYLMEVRFIGYTTQKKSVTISSENNTIDFGDIFIAPDTYTLNDVVVSSERSPVTYQIDKKVIDVDKMQTVVSGNAADVLQNVPSVTVDIDGNVSLRGSSNYTVLIDGKPSIMSAQDALQQIPASSIQTIEIITNPSAKYDPEGTAGIINIILKKNENLGLSGVLNGNLGRFENYGGDFLFQYRLPDVVLTLGTDYNNRSFPGLSRSENTFYSSNSTSFYNHEGESKWGRKGLGLRAGIEFQLSEKDLFSVVGRYGSREGGRKSTRFTDEWNSSNPVVSSYLDYSNMARTGEYGGSNITYTRKFSKKGHELKAEFNFRYNDGDDTASTETRINALILSGRRTIEYGPSHDFEWKFDYTLPLSAYTKFEAGMEAEIELSDENNDLFEYNPVSKVYEFQSLYSHSTRNKNNDQAAYVTYTSEFGRFGLQGGIRTEYTYRKITLLSQNQDFTIDRWDFFPTLHASYKFTEETQLMGSYTRRIRRPHGGELEPFLTWMDANNVRIGNPDLLPEFIDSYEAGVQTYFAGISLSTEVYYRFTQNKIENFRSVYAPNINLNSVANIGKDYSLGAEMMMIFDPVEGWNVSLMGNLYDYRIRGFVNTTTIERQSFNWSARFNNLIKIASSTQLQFNLNYNSATVTSQGEWGESYSADFSVKQDFFEKALSLTLQVRDIFGNNKMEYTSASSDFYQYSYFERMAPHVSLNVRFNFNNFKPNRERNQNGGEREMEDF